MELTKVALQNLLAIVEIAQKNGVIPINDAAVVGNTYLSAKQVFDAMQEGQVLIIKEEKKNKDK